MREQRRNLKTNSTGADPFGSMHVDVHRWPTHPHRRAWANPRFAAPTRYNRAMAKLIQRIRQWIPEDEQFSFFSLGPSPLFRRLWFYVWDYPFTPPGKVFLAGGFILSGLVGAVTVESPVYRLCMAILLL